MSIRRVVVIGAGSVGLSTAWFLQRAGAQVCVIERKEIAAGSSAGNAGWLTPSLVLPLAEPALLRSGVQMMLSPASPLYIPLALDAHLLRFLIGFARHCTARRWRAAAAVLARASSRMLAAYDAMHQSREAAVAAPITPAEPLLAVFASETERDLLVDEFRHLGELGFAQRYEVLDPSETRRANPVLSEAARYGLALEDQRFINPITFVRAIGAAVTAGGGEIRTGAVAGGVRRRGSQVSVALGDGTSVEGDAAACSTRSVRSTTTRERAV